MVCFVCKSICGSTPSSSYKEQCDVLVNCFNTSKEQIYHLDDLLQHHVCLLFFAGCRASSPIVLLKELTLPRIIVIPPTVTKLLSYLPLSLAKHDYCC